MSTPRIFNDVMREEGGFHAAWLPVTNNFKLGDYGLTSGGVFNKMGHISEFLGEDVDSYMQTERGEESTLKFSSEGTRSIRVAGGGQVDAFPNVGNLDAKLEIEFTNANSFMVSAKIAMEQIGNVAAIGEKLRQHDRWRSKYQVVRHLYTAQNCTVISSTSAGAKIELKGSASALAALDAGSVSGEISSSSNDKIGIELVGASGVLGLRLFKLRWLGGGINLLRAAPTTTRSMEIVNDDVLQPLQDDV